MSYRVEGRKVNSQRVRKNFSTKPEAEQERSDLEAEAVGQPTSAQFKRTRLSDDQLADAEAAISSADGREFKHFFQSNGLEDHR